MPRRIEPNITVSAWNLGRRADRDRYEEEVATILVLDLLNGSQVGRVVVQSIQAVPRRHLRIQPWTGRAENSETLSLDRRSIRQRGEPVRDMRGRVVPGAGSGTGTGASTVIRYSPDRYIFDVSRTFDGTQHAPVSDDRIEVLLHELCHALRMMLGVMSVRAMPEGFENDEEFFAILVTNIYSSEKRRPLRTGHHRLRELLRPDSWLNNPQLRAAVQRFHRRMPVFSRRMAQVSAPFNPFRDMPPSAP